MGIDTLLSDDPQLNVRLVKGKSPTRVVLDSTLRAPPAARALRSTGGAAGGDSGGGGRPAAAVVTLQRSLCGSAACRRAAELRRRGVRVLAVAADAAGRPALPRLLPLLADRLRIKSLMVEGGAAVIGACVRDNVVDRVLLTLAPTLASGVRPAFGVGGGGEKGGGGAAAPQFRLEEVETVQLGDDVVVTGIPTRRA